MRHAIVHVSPKILGSQPSWRDPTTALRACSCCSLDRRVGHIWRSMKQSVSGQPQHQNPNGDSRLSPTSYSGCIGSRAGFLIVSKSHRDHCRCLDSREKRQRSGYKYLGAPSSEGLLFPCPRFFTSRKVSLSQLCLFRDLHSLFSE
jgi:hypothetical protein